MPTNMNISYHTNETTRNFGDRTIIVENLTPENTKSDELKSRISSDLFEIYRKYPVNSKKA